MPGCTAAGEYRAPKSRSSLNQYWWFCLPHVREYNASWDYYRGMSPGEIEAQVRADTSWQRPTWPLGRFGGKPDESVLRRGASAFGGPAASDGSARAPDAPPELREPLQTLGLHWPVSVDTLKQRYHALAKAHHPDANGGDRGAEERLKAINLAYAAVRGRIVQHAEPAAAS